MYTNNVSDTDTNKGLGSTGEAREQELAGRHEQRMMNNEWWVGGEHKHCRWWQAAAAASTLAAEAAGVALATAATVAAATVNNEWQVGEQEWVSENKVGQVMVAAAARV